MGQATYDPEPIIQHLDALERELKALRQSLADTYTTKPTQAPLDAHAFNLDAINWQVKVGDKQHRAANLEDPRAWAFAADRNGVVPQDRKPLIDYLNRYKKVQQSGYEVSISQDGKFLSRKLLGKNLP